MRTLVDIDENILKKAMNIPGASTKKETLTPALEELIKSRLRQQLKSRMGKGMLDMILTDLRKARQRRGKAHRAI